MQTRKPIRSRAFALFVLGAIVVPFAKAQAGATCSPSAAASACIQSVLDALKPGEAMRLGPGEYGLEAPLQFRLPGIALEGAGPETVLLRKVSVSDGEGILNLRGAGQSLRRFRFDGAVQEPRPIPYIDPGGGPSVLGAPIYANPMHPELLRDSSITIHRGASDVAIEGVTIEHTGGYAIFIDARYGDIRNVAIRGCVLRNNRPHLFGRPALNGFPADLRYGAWTGGIHYQNDGRDLDFARFALRGLLVEDSTFERISGHAIWGHGYGFQTLNEDITIRRNTFSEIGLDAILIGNARHVDVANNRMSRIGYVTQSDEDLARPAWYPGIREDMADNVPPVGIDSSGLVKEATYRDNELRSVNGTAIDLDGFTEGEVLRNEIRIPGREDAYGAVIDRISEYGPYRPSATPGSAPEPPGNLTKGINLSNSSAVEPTRHVHIAGNRLLNLGGYAMLLLDSQDSVVEDNHVRHYSTLNGPIVIGNTLRDSVDRHQSKGNIVRNNEVFFPWDAHCVTEGDNLGSGDRPVRGPNYVYGNSCNAKFGEALFGRQSGSKNSPPRPVATPGTVQPSPAP